MIKNLTISNFKNLNHLELKDLNRITLISGENNVGKTSILEALVLLFDPKNSIYLMPYIANRADKLPLGNVNLEQAMSGLFNHFDMTQIIEIKTDVYKFLINPTTYLTLTFPTGHSLFLIEGFLLEYKKEEADGKEKTLYRGGIGKDAGNIGYSCLIKPESQPEEPDLPTLFINHDGELLNKQDWIKTPASPPSALSPIVREFNRVRQDNNLRKDLIEALQIIDKNIENVEIGVDPITSESRVEFLRKNSARTLPLNTLGQGVKRYFSIIIGIIGAQGGLLLIDEIENGIYFEIIKDLWEYIFELATRYDCQIIATTHSWEFASYVREIKNEHKQEFSFINFSKLKDGRLASATYDYDGFEYAIENNSEIR